jgi:S1/P1 Nuclease
MLAALLDAPTGVHTKHCGLGFVLALFVICLLSPSAALAWGYQGHRVVGSIATELLNDNAKAKVKEILNPPGSRDPSPGNHEFDLRKAGPWADCVKAVAKNPDGTFKYKLNDLHPEYELPCIPFRDERAAMEDYASRNWSTCLYPADPAKPQLGCHNTFHFDDVALQRGSFDRTYQGTNEHDLLAAIGAMIAVLSDKPIPPPVPPSTFAFSIKGKREALLLLTHFIGDLHQPLHVGSVYLDNNGMPVDPDLAHQIDPATDTVGGNSIQDQNVNMHAEWDDIPFDLGDMSTRELMVTAKSVPAMAGPVEDWPAAWATDTILVARNAFAGMSFTFNPPVPPDTKLQWLVSYEDHTAYVWMMDQIKRRQLAKGGARLAQLLNAIWRSP